LARRTAYYVEEARPSIQLVFILCLATGASLGDGRQWWHSWHQSGRVVLALLACYVGVLSIYLTNGAMDADGDKLNELGRPLARGDLTRASVLRAAWVCAVLATAIGAAAGWRVLVPVVACLVLGYAYSVPPIQLNRTSTGTVSVMILGSILTFLTGNGAVGASLTSAVVAPALGVSLWMGLVGALVKDLSDVEGDRAAGRLTLAARNEPAARRVIAAIAMTLGTGFLTAAALTARDLLLPAVVMQVGGLAVAYFLATTRSEEGRSRSRRPYRAFMATLLLVPTLLLLHVAW
jgi:4-hydroxybenzoate polyprenyltransferase